MSGRLVTGAAEVGVGDVVRAFAAVRPDGEHTTRAVAALLGFGLHDSPVRLPDVLPAPPPDEPDPEPEERDAGPAPDDGVVEQLTPVSYDLDGPETTPRWQAAQPIEALSADVAAAALPHAPLLAPRSAPALLAAAAATSNEGSVLDVEQLVEVVAAGRPVERLPHVRHRSLVRGVQVLVDHGRGMEPFARDQAELLDDLRRVVGRSAVAVVAFRDAPLRRVLPAGARQWRPRYRPPAPGTPVLALTDLGIGGPSAHSTRSRPSEWLSLATLLARRGSALVALVPYPEHRWPGRLADVAAVLPWDRDTSLVTVLAALRRAGREP